jgi:hypothetical protein
MCTRDILEVFLRAKGGRHVRLNLAAIYEPVVQKMWEPQHLKPYGPPQAVTAIALLFLICFIGRKNLCLKIVDTWGT